MNYIRENDDNKSFIHRGDVIVNLENIASNIKQIKKCISKNTKLMAVVKADAYGHGVLPVAKVAEQSGADYFGVALVDEALELRAGGITTPILVLGHTPNIQMEKCVLNKISLTVFSYKMAFLLSETCKKLNMEANIHIKIDTGMGRIGFLNNEKNISNIQKISSLPYINIDGIYTHFAQSDTKDKSYTNKQFKEFIDIVNVLEHKGMNFPIKHVSNSAAVIDIREFDLDMIRPGIILYGLKPSKEVNFEQYNLKPVLELKSYVSFIKTVEVGESIGYGRTYLTNKRTTVATIPFGYADGYSRQMSNKGRVLIGGESAPVIGAICMDQFMVDVTHIEGIKPGDEVVLIGNQGDKSISVDEVATLQNTINYEIVCDIGKRVKRIYTK